jgi:hypothetical protein
VVRSVLAEADLKFGLAGHSSVSELTPEALQRD